MRAEQLQPDPAAAQQDGPIIDDLGRSFKETAAEVVPWFTRSMPVMYFQDTDAAERLTHLRAIIAAKASNRPLELSLKSEDGSQWTMMRPLDYPGVLAEMVADLPRDLPLKAAKIHTSTDGQLVLDTFLFGETERYDPADPDQAGIVQAIVEYAEQENEGLTEQDIRAYAARCSAEYIRTITPIRFCRHWRLYQEVTGTDGAAVSLETETDPRFCRIVAAVSNSTTRTMFERIVTRLSASSINIHRAYLDTIDDGDNGEVNLLGFVVNTADGGVIDADSDLWRIIHNDLVRMKWLDERVLKLAYANPDLGLVRAEVIIALADLAHQALVKLNPYAFTSDRIMRLISKNLAVATAVADLFLDRFNPRQPLADEDFETQRRAFEDRINSDVDLEDARVVLNTLLQAVDMTFRTNVYLPDRYGLALRIDPQFLATDERPELPYGVFFVHGRAINGFHVRFRDIARGGVRAVRPYGLDQHSHESERLYDEAFGLASAQQLKNKDIPEGGSKAAVLVEPGARLDRSVKAFVDSLLDLITPDEQTKSQIVDRFGHDELLYLGPDENITPDLINWVVDRARRRGYPTPTALMSSKPGAGINHKEYGVTSEGVNVFLESSLRAVGINPKTDSFTVKITGGPDGDVAGNMIRILHRDYGTNGKIIGIADGSGCGEDPQGLDYDELLRLFREARPIAEYDRSKLSPTGRVATLDEPDGVHLRNTLHTRLHADAFVPCGGRPNALHAGNWQEYLDNVGQPTSKVIVEGANLFLTPDARRELSRCGVLIMKDSSANKCGVICSSFEIAACMMLDDEKEFLTIKDQFVEEVLVKLRALARREAELLGRVHQHHPQIPLPEMSIRLSRVMIRTSDAIERAIDTFDDDAKQMLRRLVVEHLPPILVLTAGNRLWERTPWPYLKWIMAKTLAARIVYREGFEYLQTMSEDAIAELAVRYLELELERERLILEVDKSNIGEAHRIKDLLTDAGILSTMHPGEGPE